MKQHKAQYQSRGCIFMGALLFVLMLSAVVQAAPFTTPKKLADYLYYMPPCSPPITANRAFMLWPSSATF